MSQNESRISLLSRIFSVLDPEFQDLSIFQIFRRIQDPEYLLVSLQHLIREKPERYQSLLRVLELVRNEIRRPG